MNKMEGLIMNIKDFLENYQGNAHIEIYDMFSWNTKRYNDKNMAIRDFGYFSVRSWEILPTMNKLKITIRSQM